MHGHEKGLSTTAALLAEDYGADVSAVVHSHVNVLMAVRLQAPTWRIYRRRTLPGSTTGRRASKWRAFAARVRKILRDYFGVGGLPPMYDYRDSENRFRSPRGCFRRVYLAVNDELFFQQRINATGKL